MFEIRPARLKHRLREQVKADIHKEPGSPEGRSRLGQRSCLDQSTFEPSGRPAIGALLYQGEGSPTRIDKTEQKNRVPTYSKLPTGGPLNLCGLSWGSSFCGSQVNL